MTVLFMVQMEVRLPPEMEADDLRARERARSDEQQCGGSGVRLWRGHPSELDSTD